MQRNKEDTPMHVPENWLYHNSELSGKEANKMIGERGEINDAIHTHTANRYRDCHDGKWNQKSGKKQV